MLARISLGALLLLAPVLGCSKPKEPASTGPKVSSFGQYEGYSAERFDGWVRESQYVTMRDGVKLAVDIVRPAVNGVVTTERLPVVWAHSRYHRAAIGSVPSRDLAAADSTGAKTAPKVRSLVEVFTPLQRLVKHGYAFVSVGVRGSDVSYGRYDGVYSPKETRDAYDVMEWITRQPWSDGKLGMYGGSYLGITQYMAASTKHPALKAIFPSVASFDLYDLMRAGGIYRENLARHWDSLTTILDRQLLAPPVDADINGAMAREAVKQHDDNWIPLSGFRGALARDFNRDSATFNYLAHSPSTYLPEMQASGVAAYHSGGWYDVATRDGLLWFANWKGPNRLLMGPWPHVPEKVARLERDRIEGIEQHRWFDRWLKGIQNGIDSEPPIHYAVIADPDSVLDPKTWVWKTATTWPPAGVGPDTFHFAAGKSGSVSSINDGVLSNDPVTAAGRDRYEVDPTTTTGTSTRWDNTVGQGPMHYPDLTPNDRKALTYSTPALTADVTVIGSPVVTLYLTSTANDGDFYALLEEVDTQGRSRYVTEGMLRASNRTESEPAWNGLGLPWHRGFQSDFKPLVPGEVAQLRFELQPTATLFNAGNRIRVTITGADRDNMEAAPISGRPTIELLRGGPRGSNIVLPITK